MENSYRILRTYVQSYSVFIFILTIKLELSINNFNTFDINKKKT